MKINLEDPLDNMELSDQISFENESLPPFFKGELLVWLQKSYPLLEKQWPDIEKDITKKIKKQWTKKSSNTVAEFRRQLLLLAEKECELALPTKENRQKNMGLTRKEFKTAIQQLQKGDETLIEQVYLIHFEKCVHYLINHCKSSFESAHESTLEALLEIRRDLIGEKIFYGNLGYYFTVRAKNKLYKANLKQKENYSSIDGMEFVDDERIEKNIHEDQLRTLLEEALSKICDDCRKILKQYYYEEMTLKEIAVLMNKRHDAIRQEARRCRNKLRTLLGEKFYRRFSVFFEN